MESITLIYWDNEAEVMVARLYNAKKECGFSRLCPSGESFTVDTYFTTSINDNQDNEGEAWKKA